MLKIDDLAEGDKVLVKTSFGCGPTVIGIVTEVHETIKNGLPGIAYTITGVDDGLRWAYLDQVSLPRK